MTTVRLWIAFTTDGLTPKQTREAFVEAIRDAITTAQSQGRIERATAEQLRYALTQRVPAE
jgi:hypothetical protein